MISRPFDATRQATARQVARAANRWHGKRRWGRQSANLAAEAALGPEHCGHENFGRDRSMVEVAFCYLVA
jgi:hypothetical protein